MSVNISSEQLDSCPTALRGSLRVDALQIFTIIIIIITIIIITVVVAVVNILSASSLKLASCHGSRDSSLVRALDS